ncbi:MAG: hypothetical protein FWG66_13200 [Spirochaetes bacterium]|nr:hypothetical protein [Spirochaetota bacterium]
MAEKANVQFFKSTAFYFLVGIVFGSAILFGVRPENGLTEQGVRALAVIVFTIWIWLTVNTSWTNLLFFMLLIVFGIMTPGAVWAGSMGHFAPMMIIVFYILGQCLVFTGAIDKVAAWFITRPFVRGRPLVPRPSLAGAAARATFRFLA